MIRRDFLDPESRQDLIDLTRDGSVAHRLARRANALLLLDGGMSCEAVVKVLFMDDDTVRTWYQLYQEDGIDGLASFGHEGGSCRLTVAQQDALKTWITAALPRTTREVGAWIARECGIEYQTRSGLITLLHLNRPGFPGGDFVGVRRPIWVDPSWHSSVLRLRRMGCFRLAPAAFGC